MKREIRNRCIDRIENLKEEKVYIDIMGRINYSINFGEVIDITHDENSLYLLNENLSEFEISLIDIEDVSSTCTGCTLYFDKSASLTLEVK